MSVSIRRARLTFGIAAFTATLLLCGVVGGAAVALAGPPKPDFVTEADVPGASYSPIATDVNSSWVVGAVLGSGSGLTARMVHLPAIGPIESTAIGALRPNRLTLAGGGVWGAATDVSGAPGPPVATVLRFDEAAKSVSTISADSGYYMFDITTGSNGSPYFAEAPPGSQTNGVVGKVANAPPLTVTRYQLDGGRVPYDLARGTDGGLWLLENVAGTTKIGKLDVSNPAAPTVSPEYDLGHVTASSLIGAPDGGLWFVEISAAGDASITRMSITPPTGALERHPLAGDVLPVDLARGPDGAFWFTTGDAGNVGRITPDGKYSLTCIGPGHPRSIASGPGDAMSFTEAEDRVGHIPASPAPPDSPCPPPPAPGDGGSGGGGGVKNVVKDTTPAKISLSGPTAQRFTKRGTIVVSVQCNEVCRATGRATVSVGGASRVFRSGSVTRQLAAGKRTKLTLKFAKQAVRAIGRALRKKKRLKATVAIGTRDAAGNAGHAKRSIRLKR